MGKIRGGYYLKARCIQNSDIAHSPPYVREIWDWLLKEANHSDTRICIRGQMIRTFKDIQEGLSWFAGWRKHTYSKDQCEKAMAWLRKATMIATQKTTRGMSITIVNYDKFQTPDNYDSNYESNKKATVQQQSTDTINKNDKNVKNDKNTEQPEAAGVNDLFNELYTINPTLKYGNRSQRSAASRLIVRLGHDKAVASAKAAAAVFGKQYVPTITTPIQLENKLSELVSFYKRQEHQSTNIIITDPNL